MKYINLVTKEIVDTKETMFCIPLDSYKQMIEYEPTVADLEAFERVMNE